MVSSRHCRLGVIGAAFAILAWNCAGCQAAPAATAPSASRPAATAPADDGRLYLGIVSQLASERMAGRGPMGDGIIHARDYVAGQMKQAGLAPAFAGSYLQEFPASIGRSLTASKLEFIDARGTASPLKGGAYQQPHGLTGQGEFDAGVVFAGYCIQSQEKQFDSLAGLAKEDMAGKVFVALRYEPMDARHNSLWATDGQWTTNSSIQAKAAVALRNGAAALVIVDATTDKSEFSQDLFPPSMAVGLPVIQVSMTALGSMMAAAGCDAAKDIPSLRKAADAGKPSDIKLDKLKLRGKVSTQQQDVKLHNVAAVLKGAGKLADEVILVTSHYDHLGLAKAATMPASMPATAPASMPAAIPPAPATTARASTRPASTAPGYFPGADDNASGTAGVLTIARWLADQVASGNAPVSRRTVIFVAFSGEEIGLVGSRYMANHLEELGIRKEKLAAVLNLDMIGRLRDDQLTVFGTDSSPQWKSVLEAAASDGPRLRLIGPGLGGSDHASFARVNVPALHFFTGMHKEMHRTSDLPETLNVDGAIKVARMVQKVCVKLWGKAPKD